MTELFGDEAEGIVGENGSVDYDKLQELIQGQVNSSGNFGAYSFGANTATQSSTFMNPMFLSMLA